MAQYKGYKNIESRKEYNRRYQREYIKKYRIKLKAEGRKLSSNAPEYTQRLRQRALDILGGRFCENCKCDVEELLEINHKNGGGRKQRLNRTAKQFYLDIIYNRINIKDLNVLCKVCNIQHYVEQILKVRGHKIVWNKPN